MSEKSKSTAFLLCYALGLFGAHRFYLGRWGTAVLMFLTLGGLFVWWLIDAVLIMGGKLTDADGAPLRTGAPDPGQPHAGFWVRLAAWSVDGIILQLILGVLGFFASIALGLGSAAMLDPADPLAAEQFGVLSVGVIGSLYLLVTVLYFGLQTASAQRATIGKRIFDIHVVSGAGEQLSLPRSLWRALCYLFSSLPFMLGFVLAAFDRDKRALHDRLAGTRVLHADSALPAGSTRTRTAPSRPTVDRA